MDKRYQPLINKKDDDFCVIPGAAAVANAASTKRKAVSLSTKGNMHNSFFLGILEDGTQPENAGDGIPSAPPEQPQSEPTIPAVASVPSDSVRQFDTDKLTQGKQPAEKQEPSPEIKVRKAIRISRKAIYILNSSAVVLHGLLFVGIMYMGNSKSKKIWHLKQDRIYAVSPPKFNSSFAASPSSLGGVVQPAQPFVQISDATCMAAKPNLLNFSSTNVSAAVVMWTYAQVWNPLSLLLLAHSTDIFGGCRMQKWISIFFTLWQAFLQCPLFSSSWSCFHALVDTRKYLRVQRMMMTSLKMTLTRIIGRKECSTSTGFVLLSTPSQDPWCWLL